MDLLDRPAARPRRGCMRVLQNPQEYASTLAVRLALKDGNGFGVGTQAESLVFCLQSKVFEAEWAQGESGPRRAMTLALWCRTALSPHCLLSYQSPSAILVSSIPSYGSI